MARKKTIVSVGVQRRCERNQKLASRTTLPSTSQVWLRRNSSEAVSHLLAPDCTPEEDIEEESSSSCSGVRSASSSTSDTSNPGKKAIYSTKGIANKKPVEHVEGCYCRETPVRPRLRLKRRDIEDDHLKLRRQFFEIDDRFMNHGVLRVPKNASLSDDYTIKNSREKSNFPDEENAELSFTERREDYERSRTDSSKLNLKEGQKTPASDRSYHERSAYDSVTDNLNKLKDVSAFRNDNFFETHSVKTMSSSIPDHKCVHKFRINDRLHAEPVHCDSYGISRCTICNKPMEQPNHPTKPIVQPKRKRSTGNLRKIYLQNLTPPRLNIATGKEVVEISVPEKIGRECFSGLDNLRFLKRNAPIDSLALRYQKGVM